MVHKQKIKDLEFGEKGENDIYTLINEYLNINAKKTEHYCSFDMEDENNCIEIKTRRYAITAFKEFFFPHHKLKYARNKNKKVWIVFNLIDGVYIFDYDTHESSVRIVDNQFCRRDRGRIETSKMCYCPTNLYIKLKDKIRDFDAVSLYPSATTIE